MSLIKLYDDDGHWTIIDHTTNKVLSQVVASDVAAAMLDSKKFYTAIRHQSKADMAERKRIKDLIRACKQQGWGVERTNNNHLKFTPSDNTKPLVYHAAESSANQLAYQRLLTELKASGLQYPYTPPKGHNTMPQLDIPELTSYPQLIEYIRSYTSNGLSTEVVHSIAGEVFEKYADPQERALAIQAAVKAMREVKPAVTPEPEFIEAAIAAELTVPEPAPEPTPTGVEQFICGICGFESKRIQGLKAHERNVHGAEGECDICGRKMKQSAIGAHKYHSHKPQSEQETEPTPVSTLPEVDEYITTVYECGECGLVFETQRGLTRHTKTAHAQPDISQGFEVLYTVDDGRLLVRQNNRLGLATVKVSWLD